MFRNRTKMPKNNSSIAYEEKSHNNHFWPPLSSNSRPMASLFCSKFLLSCRRLWIRRYRLTLTFIAVFVLTSLYVIFMKISSLDRRSTDHFYFDEDDRLKLIIRDLENDGEQFENSLNDRVKDLLRIKNSVLEELKSLEQKRNKLRDDISTHRAQLDIMEADAQLRNEELQHLRRSIDQTRLELQEVQEQNQPLLRAPIALKADLISSQKSFESPLDSSNCTLETCFDFSQCSIVKNFGLYIYPSKTVALVFGASTEKFQNFDLKNLDDYFNFVADPQEACLFVVLLPSQFAPLKPEQFAKLPHWRGDGRNHLIFAETSISKHFGRAIFAQSLFDQNFRPRFDIFSPSLRMNEAFERENIPVWQNLPMMVPAKRKFLLSFVGQKSSKNFSEFWKNLRKSAEFFVDAINDLQAAAAEPLPSVTAASLHFELNCSKIQLDSTDPDPIPICGEENFRASILKISSFSLVPCFGPTTNFITRLLESLKYGAVPVIVNFDYCINLKISKRILN